ncbi:MAG: serine/threonine-protein phosphatase [Lachnospiraceae bacterium]|nr:serine/threonine-protein phosphatase [Lachnospiraceae bacterium]
MFGHLTKKKKREPKQDLRDYEEDDNRTLAPMATENETIKIAEGAEECPVYVASIHDVGRRSMQQDSFGLSDTEDAALVESKGILAVVADGMGGLEDGERMSQMVVVSMLQGFDASSPEVPGDTLLRDLVDLANDAVNQDLGEEMIGKCGSTVVAVIIRENRLFWISVGDSHIYVYRNGKLVKMNRDHNYGAQLDESVARGEISIEEALSDKQRAALTSFIGIGDLELIDQNANPVGLETGDRVLLMSDGIYGTVPFERLREILGQPLKQACLLIEKEIHEKNKVNQDNYTCVILEMK